MKVFIEQPVQENKKNVFDKKTGQFLKTVPIKLTYPFPYGYILDTLAEDGDNLDCYVITDKRLETGSIIECEPIGMAEWFEDGQEDHKILSVLKGEDTDITAEMKSKITYFAEHFFDDQPDKKYRMGEFYGKEKALELLKKCIIPLSSHKDRKYEVIQYDPAWSKKFAAHAKALKEIFLTSAISIEHIGSTSVSNLAGKPTIDILVTVSNIATADELVDKLANLGYKYLGEYVNSGAYLFVQEADNTRLVNLHIYEVEHPHVKEMLQLRNYFRTHPDTVSEYSQLKFYLIKKYPNDYGQYRKFKDEWMNELKTKVQRHFECRATLGRLISSENEENWWRRELFEKNTQKQIPAELEIIAPPPEEGSNYNCFVYALGLQSDERFLGNKGWEFTRRLDELFDEMIAQSILERIENGDSNNLIVYRTDSGKISHVGLMEDEGTVISKWSWGPLLRHKIFDVPDHYGDTVEFYKISEKARGVVTFALTPRSC